MINFSSKLKKFFSIICLIAILFGSLGAVPMQARAQMAVPISTMFDYNNIMAHAKDFVLDKIAVMLANQILQRMTASVVTWINNGFEGSPAFLQNPGGFFLDAADQVTGYFLQGGTLSALCSPISIDLRLSLALRQTELLNKRYTCTLGKIIDAQKNGPDITINGQVVHSSSDSSMEGFMNGDFYQGGWPAFVSFTTEPQNNQYGAIIMAQSDLDFEIANKQATIRADLQLGNGFMSWEKCKDIPGGTVETEEEADLAESVVGADPSVKRKSNKDGTVTYQTCETQTPGSVIGGTLQRQLNVPADKLVLVKTISDSIDAILGALVNQMFMQGLAALSGHGSGTNNSKAYLQQLREEANRAANTVEWQDAQDDYYKISTQNFDDVENYKSNYDMSVDLVTASRNRLTTARSCFATKYAALTSDQFSQRNYANTQISEIDGILRTKLDPLLTDLLAKQAVAKAKYAQLNNGGYGSAEFGLETAETSANPFYDLQANISGYSDSIKNDVAAGNLISNTEMSASQNDLKTAKEQSSSFNTAAEKYQNNCNLFPTYYGQYNNQF